MSRYCDRGACSKPASWRVKRDLPSSGGITTDAYCGDCKKCLLEEKENPMQESDFKPFPTSRQV